MQYVVSNSNIAVVDDTGTFYNIPASDSRFRGLLDALRNGENALALEFCRGKTPAAQFSAKVGVATNELPPVLLNKVETFAREGRDTKPLYNFWAKVQQNPEPKSVAQLWKFLEHKGLPLAEDGDFYAYKGVGEDYYDKYSHSVRYAPGDEPSLDRALVDPDPDTDCGRGLHVGSLEYARSYAANGHLIVCKCNPKDVVSVPNDANCQKMRLCRVLSVGDYVTPDRHLPETVLEDVADFDVDDFDVTETETQVKADEVVKTKTKTKSLKQVPVWVVTEAKSELLERSLDELRKAASRWLHLVGASKIPGGKVALVKAMVRARKSL